jgi:membrane protease YdiL (CAAX protease family)
MPPFVALLQAVFLMLATLAVVACAAVWTAALARWRRGQPVLPYQPRRPVPWGAFDVVVVVVAFVVSPPLLMQASRSYLGIKVPAAATRPDAEHPLGRVLLERPGFWAVLMCVEAAVVVAPVTEELIFRLLLLGWLESLERRMRRRAALLRQVVAGLVPVTMVSLLFAAMHFRRPELALDTPTIVYLQSVNTVASLVSVAVLIGWLKFAAGATLADFGIVPGRLAADVKLGLLGFLAVTGPVYAVAFAAKQLLPENVVTDPIPILLLALALGVLYYRTHRILPAIVLHMAFNMTGVILALGGSR